MKKRILALLMSAVVSASLLAGCGSSDEPVVEASQEVEAEEADEVSDDMCSDDDFAALQEAYGYLVEEYDMIVDEYNNNDSIPQNDDLESYLADAKNLIEEMGEIDRASISEADAESLAESMKTVATSLAEVAESVFN